MSPSQKYGFKVEENRLPLLIQLTVVILFSFLMCGITARAANQCQNVFVGQEANESLLKKLAENGSTNKEWRQVGEDRVISLLSGKDVAAGFETLIDQAQDKLFLQFSGFDDPPANILEKLENKARSGVRTVLLLSDYREHWMSKERRADLLSILEKLKAAGVEVVIYENKQNSERGSLELFSENHRKLIIVDDTFAYVGSANIRKYVTNFDNGLLVEGPLTQKLLAEFNLDYRMSTGRDVVREIFRGKQSNIDILHGLGLKKRILSYINNAKTSLDLAAWSLDDVDIINALVNKRKANPNIQITVLLRQPRYPMTVFGLFKFTSLLNYQAIQAFKANGIEVRFPGPEMTKKKGIIHAKTMVVDGHYVVLGSSDFNNRSYFANRELSLAFRSSQVATDFINSIRAEYSRGSAQVQFTKAELLAQQTIDRIRMTIAKVRNMILPAKVVKFGDFVAEDSVYYQRPVIKDDEKFQPVRGPFKNIPDGSILEGSVDYGGKQPNFQISTNHPAFKPLFSFARKLKNVNIPDTSKVKMLVEEIRERVLAKGDSDDVFYNELLTEYREAGQMVPMWEYIEKQVGVCREFAILTHFALKEAGIPNRYVYGVISNDFGFKYDHAFVVITDETGTNYIVDSFHSYLNGRKLDDLTRPQGSKMGDEIAGYAKKSLGELSSLIGIHLQLVEFPTLWIPK